MKRIENKEIEDILSQEANNETSNGSGKDANESTMKHPFLISARTFYSPPRLIHDWDKKAELKTSWLELFYDLLYVVWAGNLEHILAHPHGKWGYFVFALYWFIAASTWTSYSMMKSRIDFPGFVSSYLDALLMLGVLGMALNSDSISHRVHFTFFYIATRFLSAIEYGIIFAIIERARNVCLVYLGGHAISITFALISIFVHGDVSSMVSENPSDSDVNFIFLMLATFTDFSIPVVTFMIKSRLPIHVEHFTERSGLLVMIMLGESVAAVAVNLEYNLKQYLCIALGFFVAYNIHLLYYDLNPTVEQNAMRKSRKRGRIFTYAHIFLYGAILGMGTGMKNLVETYALEEAPFAATLLFCINYCIVLLCLYTIRASHFLLDNPLPTCWITRLWWILGLGWPCLILLIIPIRSSLNSLIIFAIASIHSLFILIFEAWAVTKLLTIKI